MGRLIEGLWDCSYCNTKGNRGSIRDCPNCGRPRGEDVKFYMPEKISYVSEQKEKSINRKPDWLCAYCNSLNSDSFNICPSCGSERTSDNLDYFSIKEDNDNNLSLTTDEQDAMPIKDSKFSEKKDIKNNIEETRNFTPNFIKKHFKKIIGVSLVLLLIIGMICLFIPNNEEITIKQFEWTRSIEVERLQTVDESGWSLPSEGRLQYTRTELLKYESVLDHYETKTRQIQKQRISGYESYVSGYKDLGNGYFEEIISQRPIYETYYETETYQEPVYRDEPVYATKYYYEIDKWLYERSISTKGLDKKPYWGEIILGDDERISNRIQNYYINGIDSKEKERKISLEYDVWANLEINQIVEMRISIFGEGELVE